MAAPIRQIYDQMLEPKWVIAMGACASSGGMFNNYAILQGVDKIVPVDVHVPGCPPRPEALLEGIVRLQEKIKAGVPPAYEIRGVAGGGGGEGGRGGRRGRVGSRSGGRAGGTRDDLRRLPGLVERKDAYDEVTLVVDPARLVEACLYLRDEEGFDFLSTSRPSTTSAGASARSPATSGPPPAATSIR